MALASGHRKRKAPALIDITGYDSDEIVVASTITRTPLQEVRIDQAQNKRQRVLSCVLIPYDSRSSEDSRPSSSSASVRSFCTAASSFSTHSKHVHPPRITPISSEKQSRPTRAAARRSYAAQPWSDGEDSGPENRWMGPSRRRESRKQVVSDSSDFEDDLADSEPMSKASSEEHDSDDGGLGVSDDEPSEDEGPVRSRDKAAKVPQPRTERSKASQKFGENEPKQKEKGSRKDMKNLTSRTDADRRLDLNLPPVASIKDMFKDLTQKALKLGLGNALEHLGSTRIRVATMCSGTESPLLALQMINDALKESSSYHLDVEHLFSVEVVPYKQAYIERNFHPPLIFRDIREFMDSDADIPIATTAYGTKVPVPTDLDIVIAGTSCVDYSKTNNHKKGLEDGGESGDTYLGLLAFCRKHRPAIVILENVMNADWDRMRELYRGIAYDTEGVLLDSKNYYLPQTRTRGYMVCFDTKRKGFRKGMAGEWQSTIADFKRQTSTPVYSYLTPSDGVHAKQVAHADDTIREVEWAACEITQMQYRQAQQLGTRRPFTSWQEGGTISIPENGNTSWWSSQVERVKDTYECAVLRKALPKNGMYDIRYKHRILDLSQNVYREVDNRAFGVTGCITPTGQFFVSDAGRVLTSKELLKLQGLPTGSISLTTETPREVQDLAGNAMSTTTVGAATLAALICGSKCIDTRQNSAKVAQEDTVLFSQTTDRIESARAPSHNVEIDVQKLIASARASLRRCYCESAGSVADKPIQQCLDCGHITCISCGGNPRHNYRQDTILTKSRRPPANFEKEIRSKFPVQLRLDSTSDIGDLVSNSGKTSSQKQAYQKHIHDALSSSFSFVDVRRTHCWTVSYQSDQASLRLIIDEQRSEWQLYAYPLTSLPSNDWLRDVLQRPVARCPLSATILSGQWVWRTLDGRSESIKITQHAKKEASWWNRSGMPGFEDHMVPEKLTISFPSESGHHQEADISGTYTHLPNCGQASDSLYKQSDGREPVYLFLDPTKIGSPEKDCFVFSRNKARLEYDEARPTIGRIDSSWRPWNMHNQPCKTTLVHGFSWIKIGGTTRIHNVDSKAKFWSARRIEHLANSTPCEDSMSVLGATIGAATSEKTTIRSITSQNQDATNGCSSILAAVRQQLPKSRWRPLDCVDHTRCESCAPEKPSVRWKLNDSGAIQPYEDASAAAAFERAVKSRNEPLTMQLRQSRLGTDANLLVNPKSLAHKCLARLPKDVQNTKISWKVDRVSLYTSNYKSRRFEIGPTAGVVPHNAEVGMSVQLFPKQQLALTWMKRQEEGVNFTVEESDECVIPSVGLKLEVKVKADMFVRGGYRADSPGYGKTIVSLALIHSQFQETTPASIVADLCTRQTPGLKGLIPLSATLIVCPTSLYKQWQTEISEKLLYKKGVLAIYSASTLSRLTIEDFQKAKIIVLNRSVLGSDPYTERLAAFVGAPGPASTSGRAYTAWLDFADGEIAEHVAILQKSGAGTLRQHVENKYRRRLESTEFEAVVPSRRLRGEAYMAEKDKCISKMTASNRAPASINLANVDRPLFEMFFFNRLIVDEFHSYEPREYAAIKALKADSRWGLSATPAMDDFYDLAQVAGLLGVPLRMGSDAKGIMKSSNIRELRKERTSFELFHDMLDVQSDSVHTRIHDVDQQFLNTFARRDVMDFAELKYTEHLVPVSLDLAHRAMYTELSQHLNSLEMKMRKGKGSNQVGREERLHTAVKSSKTAEEALSKTSAFQTLDAHEGVSLASLIEIRQKDVNETLQHLLPAVLEAKLKEQTAFESWKTARLDQGTLGDQAAITTIRRIVDCGGMVPNKKRVPNSKRRSTEDEEEEGDPEDKEPGAGRTITARLNKLASKFLVSKRSLRYLENVGRIQKSIPGQRKQALSSLCELQNCNTTAGGPRLAVSALCGHLVCEQCFEQIEEHHTLRCGATGCSSAMHSHHLLWSDKMGDLSTSQDRPYGAKMQAAVKVLRKIERKGEQAILFVQYESQLDQVQKALELESIPATVVKQAREAGSQIDEFRDSALTDDKITVIVLNASDETAAGSNLQNANHVIFLSPLLRDSQYSYDSTMAQAIGRVRRHGQQKHIHVYRIVALDTIDVDILEHRERRSTALIEQGAPDIAPPPAARKLDTNEEPVPERTQLVKENGKFSLRPQSWLVRCGADEDPEEVAKVKGKNRVAGWEDFSSLVKFSRAYTEDDD